jgi:N-acetylmuramoyl-L-alanine amidase-like protein
MLSSLATVKLVPYVGLGRRSPRKAAVLHTNGGNAPNGSLFSLFSGNASGAHGTKKLHLGAHFQIKNDGSIEQYVDTDLSVGHAWDANSFAVGIETQDDNQCRKRWTDAQVDSIVALLMELGVPPKLLEQTPSDGVGWHRQYDSWNLSKHSCPCDTRQMQVTSAIIPGLEDELSKSNDYFEQLERDGVDPRQYSTVVRFEWGYQRGIRKRPLGETDAQDDVKVAGFEHGVKEAEALRAGMPGPRVPTPGRGGTERRGGSTKPRRPGRPGSTS